MTRLQGWHNGRVFQSSINKFRKSDNKKWIVNSGKQCHVKVIHLYYLSILVIYLTSSKQNTTFDLILKFFLLRGGVKVGLTFYPWKIHGIIHTIPNRIQWKIHGTGIFTYMNTIKINHSCREISRIPFVPWIRSGKNSTVPPQI